MSTPYPDHLLCSAFKSFKVLTPLQVSRCLLEAKDAAPAGVINEDGSSVFSFARVCKTRWLPRDRYADIYQSVMKAMKGANDSVYHFDIDRLEDLQLTVYPPFGRYAAHFDNGNTPTAHRKLTMSISLKPCGRGLTVYGQEIDRAPCAPGDALVFPSYVSHNAYMPLFGTHIALIAWAIGHHPLR